MNRNDVFQLLRDFESQRAGQPFEWRDVEFWPLIRSFLGMELHKSTPFEGLIKPPVSLWSRRAGVVRRMLTRLNAYRRWVRNLERQRGHPLLATRADRRRRFDGQPFHRMATPLRAFLAERDLPLSVWEFDRPPYRDPTAIPTQGVVQWQWMFSPERQRKDPAPEWFDPLRAFLSRLPVETPPTLHEWPFWRALFGSILFRAGKYEHWLGKMAPRLVFVDAWYVSDVLPVIIAARRKGIPTVDLQHGLQGASHFGYAAWPDLDDSPLVPDTFWFWGERDLKLFQDEDNALNRRARGLVGGSLELNHFREHLRFEPAGNKAERKRVTVLITEQKDIDIRDIIVPAVEKTGDSIQWLIRPHPGQTRSALEGAFIGPEQAVTFISPSDETVAESLARSDIHVTGFSSVALEALALGRMTILVHPSGEDLFGEYIQRNLMQLALEPDQLIEAVTNPPVISSDKYEEAVRGAFATPEATRNALQILLTESEPRSLIQ